MLRRLLVFSLLVGVGSAPVASAAAADDTDQPQVDARLGEDEFDGEGSVAITEGGASVTIPSGHTIDGRPVGVRALTSPDALPPSGDPAAFVGGIALEPHGAVFDAPVTITIPLTRRQEPGLALRLYHWDDTRDAWEETGFVATVATDGWTASGEVTHFSYYVLQPSQVEAEDEGVFGDIAGVVSSATVAGADLATVTHLAFAEVVAHVNARFPLGDARPLDVPIPDGYNCYAPVGLYFSFDHGGADGVERPLVETIGDIDDVEFRIDYLRDVDVTVKHGDVENELTGSFSVNVYWRSTPPTVSLEAGPTKLWGGDRSLLKANVTCGDLGMLDRAVDFAVPVGADLGSLEPVAAWTDKKGRAGTVLTSDETGAGPMIVEAAYEWSSQDGDVQLTLTDQVELVVGALTGTWRVRGSERWRNCTDPTEDGVYAGSGTVHFLQAGGTFTGFGRFPRSSDLITGTVRRVGDTKFIVQGTSRYVDVSKQADRDDDDACARGHSCETWETYGVVRFQGKGSIETRTIQFTWKGHDTDGDTCIFTGKGKATYRSH